MATTLPGVGIPAWIWFVVAIVAAGAGLALLLTDRAKEGSRNRERTRWAELRGWQFVEEDERLPQQFSAGAIGYFGIDLAVNIVAGSTFTQDGRRQVFVFDVEVDGQIPTVLVAVRCNRVHSLLLELWLASVPFQRPDMPELIGPVGQRYAFADDLAGARTMVTQELVDAADALGGDVGVMWLENEWVLASVVPSAGPSRLERLLRDLGEIADIVDPVEDGEDEGRHWQQPQQAEQPAEPQREPRPAQPSETRQSPQAQPQHGQSQRAE